MNNTLQELFVTNNNADMIISAAEEMIRRDHDLTFKKDDKHIFNIFNTIASAVFSHEQKNFTRTNTDEALKKINNIVIKELVKFLTTKHRGALVKVVKSNIKNNDIVVVEEKTIEEKFVMVIDKPYIEFKGSPIQNVSKIQLSNVSLYNSDYIINKTNNRFLFYETIESDKELYSENFSVELDQGDYTIGQLLSELQDKIRKCTDHEYFLEYDEISRRVTIYSDYVFNIISTKSSILDVLGFSSHSVYHNEKRYRSLFPVKLIKSKKISVNVNLNQNINITQDILMTDTDSLISVDFKDVSRTFKVPEDIEVISIDFGDHDTRNFPFYLTLEITQVVTF